MAIEAYKIYIELVTEAPLGPLNDLLRTMGQVEKVQQDIQTSINDMAAGLRGSTRMAQNLAAAMQSVARASKEAAASARGIRPVGGGTGGGAGAAPNSGTTYSSPSRAAAASTAQLLLTGPRQAPLALPYYPNTSRTDVTGRTPWPNQVPGNGFALNGPAYGPSNSLVPVGPRMDRSDVIGASPNRGALVPIGGGGAGGSGSRGGNYGPGVPNGDPYQPPHGGLPTVYVPPPPGHDAPDEPYSRRMTLNPNPPKGGKGINPMHLVVEAATTGFAVDMVTQAAIKVLTPAFDVDQESRRIAAETRQSPADVQPIVRAAFDQQRQVAGTNVVGNLEAFRMLFSLTQNQSEAETLLPNFLKVGTALQAFNPGSTYDQQLESVFKSAEFLGAVSKTDPKTGKTSVDAGGAQKVARLLLSFETVSNGAVDPDKFLAFLRSGGSAAANMDLAEIAYLLPVIQSLNPRGAGQGLKSFEQQFSSGKMSQGVLEMLTEMGIVKNPGDVRKIGIGQFMLKPGALDEKVVLQAVQDPVDFYKDTLLPGVDKYLTKNYGKIFSGADTKQKQIMEGVVLQQVSSRIPGGTLLSELLRIGALGIRDANAVGKANSFDLAGTLNQSPITQVAAFTGALDALLAVFAAPALKGALGGMNEITAAMNALTRAGQDHGGPAATAVSIGSGAAAHAAEGAIAAGTIALLGRGLSAVGFGTAAGVAGVGAKIAMKGSLWGTISLAAAQAADAATEGLVNKYDPNFGRGADKSVGILSALDKWAFKLTGDPFFNVAGGSSAPRGAPPAPIATKTNPLPVVVTNGKDLMQSVDDHTAKQMSAPPTGQTGASFGASPAWAGRPGFSP